MATTTDSQRRPVRSTERTQRWCPLEDGRSTPTRAEAYKLAALDVATKLRVMSELRV